MKNREIKSIIVMVALTLLLLIGVQLYWIQNAYNYRENQVKDETVQILQKTCSQTMDSSTCFELFGRANIRPHEGIFFAKQPWTGKEQFVPGSKPDTVRMFFLNSYDTSVAGFSSIKFSYPITAEFTMKCQLHFNDTSFAGYPPSTSKILAQNTLRYNQFKSSFEASMPITKKLRIDILDTLLKKMMAASKPGLGYHFGIIRNDNDSAEYTSAHTEIKKLKASAIQASLVDGKYFSHPYRLALYYDSDAAMALQRLWGILITSAVVIVLLCYAFWYFVKTIMAQKKLSEMKTDFINNMTHEFKTPITNIGLAVENINDKGDLNGSAPFLRIIGEENNRLRENVERILQIASLDRDEMSLQLAELDINHLIERISQNLELSNYRNNPQIICNLLAESTIIIADETHIINVIYNLLDNALKYNQGRPLVKISTANVARGVVITVEDNGIGMDAETQKRIFEKFYRAHTGNIHNVKGFGLGLSYVKNLVDLHQGGIKLRSEPGKGSRFDIFLPFQHKNQPASV